MVVSAQDARDFCLTAATIIPVFILALLVGQRFLFETSLLKLERRGDWPEDDTLNTNKRLKLLQDEIVQTRERLSGDPLDFLLTKELASISAELTKVDSDSHPESDIREKLNIAEARLTKVRRELRGMVNFYSSVFVILTVLGLIAGLIGEFIAFLGSTRLIDRLLAVSASGISMSIMLTVLVALGCLRIGEEYSARATGPRPVTSLLYLVSGVVFVLGALFIMIMLHGLRGTP